MRPQFAVLSIKISANYKNEEDKKMNGSIICPNCNREIGANNKFCPYCGGKLGGAQPSVQLSQGSNMYQLSPNTVLNGRYRIESIKGEGDNFISYLAEDITLQMKVVVNEFFLKGYVNRDSADSQNVVVSDQSAYEQVQKCKNAFQEEARNRAKLSGLPGIVEVRDYFEQNGTAYTVMEWLNGGSLQDFIERNGYGSPTDVHMGIGKRITMDMAKQIMEPIITSLIKAHDAGVLHGDICPDNMALNNKGSLKLLHAATQTTIGSSSDKTVMLNMGYAPIENYHSSGSKGPWSDVYSLCATIYKCITGIQPIDASERAYQDTLKKPSELGIQINPYDEAALMTGLAVNVDKRFVDMKVLYKALYRTSQQSQQTPQIQQQPLNEQAKKQKAGKEPDQNSTNQKKTNVGLIIGIVVAAVMLVAVVIVGALVLPNVLSGNELPSKATQTIEEQKKDEKEEEKTEAIEPQEETELSEKDLLRIELIDEQAAEDASYTNQKDVLEQYYAFAADYNAVKEVSEQVEECFGKYQTGIIEHVNMLDAQDVFPAMYIQMRSEIDTVIELAERFEEVGIELNYEETESRYSVLQVDYKQRLVDNFDSKAIETINNNGVISRSVLWAAMENADQTGLFDNTNPEDPLRLRYVAALTFHTDSELAGVDPALDTSKIYEVLEATDYSPLLLYYLSYNYGDDKAKEWYKEVNSIMASTVGDFDSLSINDKKNMIFYLNANGGDYATAREQIREYMQQNFVKP